jgi:hypothetical protein
LSPIYTTRAKTIENFSYPNRTCLTPHAGPTRHMFLEVDMVEGLCSTKKIAIWRAFLPKTNYFSHPPRAYPRTLTHDGPTRPPLGKYNSSLHNPTAPNRRPTASASLHHQATGVSRSPMPNRHQAGSHTAKSSTAPRQINPAGPLGGAAMARESLGRREDSYWIRS